MTSSNASPSEELPRGAPTDDQDASLHRTIHCEACGKRMLVSINEGTSRHRCPMCGAHFVTHRENLQVAVHFGDAPPAPSAFDTF